MTDTIEMNTENSEKNIRPLEVPERIPIYVYSNSHKGSRQLTRFGDVNYTSQKAHYSVLYINQENLEATLEELKKLKFVKKIRVGHIKELNKNFSEAFAQTNSEVKQEMEL
ncbi:YlbG family protein [Lactococcus nasutitermitis]|uniref:YlbG family protein n=1 Tax=Lactococcus nasutitermitis TaxID=1652957 RepID=A0ABV9JFS7_9LACT|nr:YlbG family protein [Lactococcus nasutitermitis]